MSNWLQDALPALREAHGAGEIIGRSARAVHLKKGEGALAFFSGAPMHYWDKSSGWQALDTALEMAVDGWYGAPGLTTRIHPDGRVRISGSDYEQYTPLPGNPHGVLAGDRIVRQFPGGEQRLILTPSGLHEEILLERRTTPARQFLARHSGQLPARTQLGALFAVDADGAGYLHTEDDVAFHDWLDQAAYPVLIDPDFTSDAADGYVYGASTNYSAARATSSNYVVTNTHLNVGQIYDTGGSANYSANRAGMKFDTSSLGAGAIVNQVNLALTLVTDVSERDFNIEVTQHDWSGEDPISASNRESFYDGALAATKDVIFRSTSGWSVGVRHTSPDLGTGWINGTGFTYYGLRSERDKNGNAPSTSPSLNGEYVGVAAAEYATAADRPILTIDFSPGYPTPAAIALAAVVQPVTLGNYDTRIKLRAARRDTALTTRVRG